MLLMTRSHHMFANEGITSGECFQQGSCSSAISPYTGTSQFIPSTKRIAQFSEGHEPRADDRIVYVAGAFDLFHIGHLDFLEKARKEGTYLIVGLHTDQVVNSYKKGNNPIMNMHERILGVLSNRYVSEVVIGAPYSVSAQLMDHFNVDLVVHGTTELHMDVDGAHPYEVPKSRGKFKQLNSCNELTTQHIIKRIIDKSLEFQERNKRKQEKELQQMINNH